LTKLKWKKDGLYLGKSRLGFVEDFSVRWAGFVYEHLTGNYVVVTQEKTRKAAMDAVENAVKERIGL
jgi:hypothetical protein